MVLKLIQPYHSCEDREARALWRRMVHAAFGYLPDDQLNMLISVNAIEVSDGLLVVELREREALEWVDRYCPLINAYLSRWRLRLCVDFRPHEDRKLSVVG